MADTNIVILIGRLTRDAELSYTSSGTAIGKMSIANGKKVNKGGEWQDETSYFDVEIWGKTAEALQQYLTKGKQIAVEGELKQDRWQDKDGNARSKVKITAKNIQLLGK